MPNARDTALLAGELPELIDKYDALQAKAADVGIVFEMNGEGYGGLRTTDTQAKLKQFEADSVAAGQGAYAVAAPGKSKHEMGAAFDVVITDHNEVSDDAAYRKLADLGREVGLTAGYYFKSVPSDPYHFELSGTLDVLRARFSEFAASAGRSLPGSAHRGSGGSAPAHGGVK